jgi:hypothetical protein
MAADARKADPSAQTAVVMWLGYDAPDGLSNAGDDQYADHAAGDFRRFQAGLRATQEAGDSNHTVLGHSYGTLVVGHAASDGHSLDADQAILIASPGVDVDHATDLSLRHHDTSGDNVWTTTAKNDMIRRVPNWDLAHGAEPTSSDFGANVFESDPGDPDHEKLVHSEYWDKGNKARKGLASIITGQKPAR